MGLTAVVLPLMMASAGLASGELRYFPGEYFDSTARTQLQRRAMEKWPGPVALVELWNSGELTQQNRMAVLIGGAVHHDPVMLPIYREAIESKSARLRQAAAYGYHNLLADRVPDVRAGVSLSSGRRLGAEMDQLAETLRRHPLIAIWLNGALRSEGSSLPGYRGVEPGRSLQDCTRSIERIMRPEDLDLLVRAYQEADELRTRVGLLRLIEGMTLHRFVVKPTGPRTPWGQEIYDRGFDHLDRAIEQWTAESCVVDFEVVVSQVLAERGLPGVDPLEASGCGAWQRVLVDGDSRWWSLAARQLYDCGGPWIELSVLGDQTKQNEARKESLIRWFGLQRSPARPDANAPSQGARRPQR
jgi:hypothetical protein